MKPGHRSTSMLDEALFCSETLWVIEWDTELRIRRASRHVAVGIGCAPEELIGRSLRDIVRPSSRHMLSAALEALRTGRGVESYYAGELFIVRGAFEPIVRDGEVVGLLSVFVDAGAADLGSSLERLRFEELFGEIVELLLPSEPGCLFEVLDEVLQRVGTAQGFDCVIVRLLCGPVRSFTWSARDGIGERVGRLLDRPEVAAAIARGKPIYADPLEGASADEFRDLVAEPDICTIAVVPLRDISGWIAFVSSSEYRLSLPLRRRLSLIADAIAGAFRRAELEHRAAAVADERVAFERMLSSIAASFVACPTEGIDDAISNALVSLCEGLNLVRAAVYQRLSPTSIRMTHRSPGDWVTQPGQDVELRGVFPQMEDPLRKLYSEGPPLVIARTDLSDPIAANWDATGIRSAVHIPLVVAGEPYGTVLLLSREAHLGKEFLGRTRWISNTIAHALARKRAEDARAAAFAELAGLKASAEQERDYLREQMRIPGVVVESPALRRVVASIDAVARTHATVLLRGETGVGKEVFARMIHERSTRAEGPLVRVNCASIPLSLFESEFFGHVRGSFTGAHRDRIGRFELASGGTLFLDEIGEVPLELQAKLLRVLQEGELERVGDDRTRRVDVRVVAATNRDLEHAVEEGRFRSDLYYRLAVFPIVIPPLRERPEDIVPLARHFVSQYAKRAARAEPEVTREDAAILTAYAWPGNVRELANVIERALIFSVDDRLGVELAMPAPTSGMRAVTKRGDDEVRTLEQLRELERDNLVRALDAVGGQIAGRGGAAERLGVSPSTLRDRMRAFGIAAPTTKKRTRRSG